MAIYTNWVNVEAKLNHFLVLTTDQDHDAARANWSGKPVPSDFWIRRTANINHPAASFLTSSEAMHPQFILAATAVLLQSAGALHTA